MRYSVTNQTRTVLCDDPGAVTHEAPPPCAPWFLASTIGVRRAMQFAFLQSQLDAAQALQLAQVPLQAFRRTRQLPLQSTERTLRASSSPTGFRDTVTPRT